MVWGLNISSAFQCVFFRLHSCWAMSYQLGPYSFSIILSLVTFSSSCLNCFSNASYGLMYRNCVWFCLECEIRLQVHQLSLQKRLGILVKSIVFREIVNFSNTIFFRQHKWITKLFFNNTTKKVFYLQHWIWFAFGAARLVEFRLVSVVDEMA